MRTIYILGLVIVSLIQTRMCHHESEEKTKLLNSHRNEYNFQDNHIRREKRLTNKERYNNAFINDDWYVFDIVEGETTAVTTTAASTPVITSINRIAERTRTTSRPPFPNTIARRPSPCEEACNLRTTPQYNPVCGDNGVTYNNNAGLDCATFCGQSVQILHLGRCGPLLPFR